MDFDSFRASIAADTPPAGLSLALQGLWYDAKSEWERAHACAQDQDDAAGAWVHAYLHRVEGDTANAAYWYRRAGKPVQNGPLPAEWEQIVRTLLRDD